jgi:hypothetical protein
MAMSVPAMLDLTQLSVLAEIIIRGGDLHDAPANVRRILQNNYRVLSQHYGVYGLSVLVNANMAQPAAFDQLAQRNPIFNRKLSLSVIGSVAAELQHAGYGMILYATPSPDLPDHHSLAVFDLGDSARIVHHTLPDPAADALISAFHLVVDNPYPKPRP